MFPSSTRIEKLPFKKAIGCFLFICGSIEWMVQRRLVGYKSAANLFFLPPTTISAQSREHPPIV